MKLKAVLLAIMAVLLLQGELFPRVTCRLEGTVQDKDTKEPVGGAVVKLFSTTEPRVERLQVQTDRNGCFIFDDRYIFPGEYFLQCYSKGYVPFLPDYYRRCLSGDDFKASFKVFNIKEGEIKHIRLKLEKGGTLKGVFLKKTQEGTSNFKNLLFDLDKRNFSRDEVAKVTMCKTSLSVLSLFANRPRKKYEDGFFVHITQDGEFTISGLEPGSDYYLIFRPNGYWQTELTGIVVEKGKTNTLHHTIDLTTPSGIHGTIKAEGRVPDSGTVYLYPLDSSKYEFYKFCRSDLDGEGKYSCLGLPPGKYDLELFVDYNKGKVTKKSIVVGIEAGKTKTLDFNF